MPACVALLRGINVGGHNKLPMAGFRQLLERLGCEDVSTYIQSGNAVFCSEDVDGLDDRIGEAVEQEFGFRPPVLVLDAESFRRVADENPYAADDIEPKFIHIGLLFSPAPNVDFDKISSLQGRNERYEMTDLAFYLSAPDGIARSKLAADLEKCLGVPITARNWRSVSKLREMLETLQ